MKRIVVLAVLALLTVKGYCVTYYSQASSSPSNLASWNSDRAGAGSIPASFTNTGDVFVIQSGHTLVTTGSWTIGSSSFKLEIESGGVLQGDHAILLTGAFQIDNGGYYIHNNNASVSTLPGASIFGASLSLNSSSTIEIRNWTNNNTTLPASVNWGDLVINYSNDLGGSWNQQAAVSTIQGNLVIMNTGTAGQEFRMTDNTNLTLNIGGNLLVQGGDFVFKSGNGPSASALAQINGNISVTGGILNVGSVDLAPHNEFRFKGDLLVSGSGSILSLSSFAFLVANGNAAQSINSSNIINGSFKIAQGASVNLNADITIGATMNFVIAGVCNTGNNAINMNGGQLAIAGGTLNSGNIGMKDGTCQVCSGDGSFGGSNGWCLASGQTGTLNCNAGTILFNRSLASALRVGFLNSPGTVNLTDSAKVSFTGILSGSSPNRGTVEVKGNGILSLDETSILEGDGNYFGNSGTLVIGSASGITTSSFSGNVQLNGTRNYSNSGINSFEYKSSLQQFTGNGLPANITGILKINNNSGSGVTLTSAVSVSTGGGFNLATGVLKTNSSLLLTLQRNTTMTGGSAQSFVEGPLKKIGEQDFTFHVGHFNIYSPVVMQAASVGAAADAFTVEYIPGDPHVYGSNYITPIDHISNMEYWAINGPLSRAKTLTFKVNHTSAVNNFNDLVVGYFDGTSWLNNGNQGVTGTPDNGTIHIGANNFGPFAFAFTDPADILCPGAGTTFSMPQAPFGYNYQWQVDDGSGFANITDDATYSGTSTTVLTFSNVPSSVSYYAYRCIASFGEDTVISNPEILKIAAKWTGSFDSAWENPANWSCGIVPDANMDVVIPGGMPNQPTVNSNVFCRSLTVNANASVTVSSGFNLTLTGPPGPVVEDDNEDGN